VLTQTIDVLFVGHFLPWKNPHQLAMRYPDTNKRKASAPPGESCCH
jgi:hypothetical protein